MKTRAEMVGAGALALGDLPGARLDHPAPHGRGEPMGQHLAVDRLVRVMEERLVYLVDNKSRKWPRRKCWACGYKYSPEMARSCAYCATPLEDLQFLMTQRWAPAGFPPYEAFIRGRIHHFGLIAPVFAFYRGASMMSVYHYNGESFLVDAPAPLAGTYLLAVAVRCANTLAYLHQRGVVLGSLRAGNIVIMPNGSVRLFDLDVAELLDAPGAVWRHPAQPAARDAAALGQILGPFVAPEDEALAAFFRDAARGAYPGPVALADAAAQLHEERRRHEPDPRLAAHAAAISDVGLARSENEDAAGWRRVGDRAVLYAVADGLGGHTQGKVASHLAIDTIAEYLARRGADLGQGEEALAAAMRAAVEVANRAVHEHRARHRLEMGTTLCAALVVDQKHLVLGHAGDTRAYLLRDGALRALTRDDTLAQDLVDDGMITPEDALNHRGANILTQTVGGDEAIEAHVSVHALRSGDRVLLCSDGLYRPLGEEGLRAGLAAWPDRHKTARRLLKAALAAGSTDNVTAVVVDVP